MKTLYLDCPMGAAGDMLCAALLELFPEPEKLLEELNSLSIPHVKFQKETVTKCGIVGTHLSVKIYGEEESWAHHHHSHHSLEEITGILDRLDLPKDVRAQAQTVYDRLAEAESSVHGVPVSEIHFHEVGNLDAIADITAFCYLLNRLSPQRIVVSPIHVGSGQICCAHGILPVPAPATAYLLKGCPIYGGTVKGELCTPTGAALLTHFADDFGDMPVMSVRSIGYGMGKKDFEAANCVRAFWGETDRLADSMIELNCNVDDMTAEQIGYALECFFKEGAVEAFTIPVNMKKSRPGTLIRVLCREDQKEKLIRCIFKHTSTAGIRETTVKRSVLDRQTVTIDTPFGPVRKKEYSGYGVQRFKYEYEDLAEIASKEKISIEEVLEIIKGAGN